MTEVTPILSAILVHETFVRLVARDDANRRILMERAGHKQRLSQGGGRPQQSLHSVFIATPDPDEELLALDGALVKFTEHDLLEARLVERRYIAGFPCDRATEMPFGRDGAPA